MTKFYFYINIILLNIISFNSKKIVIPFKTVQNTDSNFIKTLLQNQIYTQLEIGSAKQTVYLAISTEADLFAVESYLINETFYSAEKSTSYKNNTYMYYYENYKRMKKGYILNDTFYFKDSISKKDNSKKYENIMFNYITELSPGYSGQDNGYIDNSINLISGIIGLQITRKYLDREEIIFIKSLKNIEAIDKVVWSINYENDNEGYLILGEYPHQYDKKLKEADIINIGCITLDYEYYWYFTFTDIKIGENKMKNYRTAEYAPQLGLIIGTSEYQEIITPYFDSLEQCSLIEIEYKKLQYFYYECDKNVNLNDFEPILFIHHGTSSCNFTLDKEDLFVDFNDKKYFLVVFKKATYNQRWVLGKPFVIKYKFAFDHDAKAMLFYQKNNNSNNSDNNKKKNHLIFYIIISLLGIIVIVLGIFIGKYLFGKKKKKKANEMEDNMNDEYQDSINENNNKDSTTNFI